MSWTAIRTYFNTKCEAQGFVEWTDAFNTDDIPSTVINESYHVQFGDFDGEGQNQTLQETLVGIEVQFFLKGFATPKEAVDTSIEKAELLVKSLVKTQDRLTQGFKNVIFRTMSLEPFADSNDNIVRARLQFSVRVMLDGC